MNILYINLFLRSFSKVKFPDMEFLGPSVDMFKAVSLFTFQTLYSSLTR